MFAIGAFLTGVRLTMQRSDEQREKAMEELVRGFPDHLDGAKPIHAHYEEGSTTCPIVVPNVHGDTLFLPRVLSPEEEEEFFPKTFQAKQHFHDNMRAAFEDYHHRSPNSFPRIAYCEGVPAGNEGASHVLRSIRNKIALDGKIAQKRDRLHIPKTARFSDMPPDLQDMMRSPARLSIHAAIPAVLQELAANGGIGIHGIESPALNEEMRELAHRTVTEAITPELEQAILHNQDEREIFAIETVLREGKENPFVFMGHAHQESFVGKLAWSNQHSAHPVSYIRIEPLGIEQVHAAINTERH